MMLDYKPEVPAGFLVFAGIVLALTTVMAIWSLRLAWIHYGVGPIPLAE